MHDLIRRIAHWLGVVLASRHGADRTGTRQATTTHIPRTTPATPAPAGPAPLPLHRSPYGIEPPPVPLDGQSDRLVRPYLLAHENEREQARQRYRRLALVLAADFGIDLDPHVIGARLVAA
ncbi:hypothetical protein ABZ667_01340 [Streptomyces lavendulae]|uniref:hypothetical protein n=1 Tax=Streptomyces lavendulae TaxID=1914 RepID=UPI0033FFEAFA